MPIIGELNMLVLTVISTILRYNRRATLIKDVFPFIIYFVYNSPLRKRRSTSTSNGSDVGVLVSVSEEMRLTVTMTMFVSNSSGKQALINLLALEIANANITIEQAAPDAD